MSAAGARLTSEAEPLLKEFKLRADLFDSGMRVAGIGDCRRRGRSHAPARQLKSLSSGVERIRRIRQELAGRCSDQGREEPGAADESGRKSRSVCDDTAPLDGPGGQSHDEREELPHLAPRLLVPVGERVLTQWPGSPLGSRMADARPNIPQLSCHSSRQRTNSYGRQAQASWGKSRPVLVGTLRQQACRQIVTLMSPNVGAFRDSGVSRRTITGCGALARPGRSRSARCRPA